VTAKVSTTTGSVRELSDDELLAIIHCTTGGSV
jgi:hypothetical protein